jgi:hypothetical protein
MDKRLLMIIAAAAAIGYLFYKSKETPKALPVAALPESNPGMGRRIHKPDDYQLASFIVGLNGARASTRNQNISKRSKKILDAIKLPGGKKIKVDGRNNIYIGAKYGPQSKQAWNDYVSEQAAILAYRTDDFYPKKPPIYSSLSTAEFRKRFKTAPENVYKTKWAPRNKKLKARQP